MYVSSEWPQFQRVLYKIPLIVVLLENEEKNKTFQHKTLIFCILGFHEEIYLWIYMYLHLPIKYMAKVGIEYYKIYCTLQAVRTSIYGRPGVCYIDIPGNFVQTKVNEEKVR